MDELPEIPRIGKDDEIEFFVFSLLPDFIEPLVAEDGEDVERPDGDCQFLRFLAFDSDSEREPAVLFPELAVDPAGRRPIDEKESDPESSGPAGKPDLVEFPLPRQLVSPAEGGPAAERFGRGRGQPEVPGAKGLLGRGCVGPMPGRPSAAEPSPSPPVAGLEKESVSVELNLCREHQERSQAKSAMKSMAKLAQSMSPPRSQVNGVAESAAIVPLRFQVVRS